MKIDYISFYTHSWTRSNYCGDRMISDLWEVVWFIRIARSYCFSSAVVRS